MRALKRNQSALYYRIYLGKQELTDDYGNATGEYLPIYSDPIKFFANVSPATGQSNVEQFGTLESYDKVIVTEKMDWEIDENSVFYIDTPPVLEFNNETNNWSSHDYIIRRIAKSLNSISVAVSKVKVS